MPHSTSRALTIANLPPTGAILSGPATIALGQLAQFEILGATDAPDDLAAGLKYSFDFTDDGIYDVVDAASPALTHTYATAGNYTVRAKIADKDGGFMEATRLLQVIDPSAIALAVNNGDVQRSRITSIAVTFDMALDVTIFQNPGAVTLTRTSGGPVATVTIGSGLVVTPGAGATTTIALTFQNVSSNGIDSASLADGRWQLAIPSLSYTSQLNTANLRRVFGDADANGTVDASDFAAFGSTFGTTGSGIAFDFDNNGTIDATDFAAFGARFGVTL